MIQTSFQKWQRREEKNTSQRKVPKRENCSDDNDMYENKYEEYIQSDHC